MAREGYLIMDSDLHMMEPDDLWARYLDEPHRANPPRFFGGQQQQLAAKLGGQGQRRHDHGNGGAGPGDPGARQGAGRDRLQPRAEAPQPRAPPAFQCRAGARLRSGLDPDGDGYRGHRRRRDVRHARPADPVPRRSGARLCGGARPRLQQLGRRLLQDRPAAPQIRGADRDARHPDWRSRRRAAASPNWARSRSSARPTRSTASTCTTTRASRLWDELERLNVPIGYHPTGNTSLKDDAGRALCRARQFPPDRARHPQPGRADGGDRQHDHRRRPRTPSEAALRLSRRHGRMALLVAVAARRPMGEVRPGLRASDRRCCRANTSSANATSRSMSTRSRRSTSSTRWARNILSCRRDYPHSDGAFPEAIEQFLSLPLDDEQRRKILWDNCARLYDIAAPAAPLTREPPAAASAAE